MTREEIDLLIKKSKSCVKTDQVILICTNPDDPKTNWMYKAFRLPILQQDHEYLLNTQPQ